MIEIGLLILIALLIAYFGFAIRSAIIKNQITIESTAVGFSQYIVEKTKELPAEIEFEFGKGYFSQKPLEHLERIENHVRETKHLIEEIKSRIEKIQAEEIAHTALNVENTLEAIDLKLSEFLSLQYDKPPLPRNPELKDNPMYQMFMDDLDREKNNNPTKAFALTIKIDKDKTVQTTILNLEIKN